MTLLLLTTALAADRSGLYLPGAASFSGGELTVRAAGVGAGDVPSLVSLNGGLALGDRLSLSGSLGLGGTWSEGFELSPIREGFFAARYLVLEGEHVRVGPWASVGSLSWPVTPEDTGVVTGVVVGLAAEAGGERVWGDGSVPVYGNFALGPKDWGGEAGTLEVLRGSEVGLNVQIGDHHRVRLGMVSILPNVGWQAELGMLTGGLTVGALPYRDAVKVGVLGEVGVAF